MNTKLLTKNGDVFKILEESKLKGFIIWTCRLMYWCNESLAYLESRDQLKYHIGESLVEVIDTNDAVIRQYENRVKGFE